MHRVGRRGEGFADEVQCHGGLKSISSMTALLDRLTFRYQVTGPNLPGVGTALKEGNRTSPTITPDIASRSFTTEEIHAAPITGGDLEAARRELRLHLRHRVFRPESLSANRREKSSKFGSSGCSFSPKAR